MSWEDILKGRSKLTAEQYRIMRQIVADTIDVYDEFEQYELNDLFLERYREEINDTPRGRPSLTSNKVRAISTRLIKNIGTHELKVRYSDGQAKRYWVRK
jgi:hypothetical protein|tara:strand:+ start:1207 stop:1506 length:300 start_codon:yes stop_codon:yes gene_type:complete